MSLLKRLWWIFGPLVVAGGLLFSILIFTKSDGPYPEKILDRAAVSLESSTYKGRGLKHGAFTDKEKNYVPFFGSSELTRFDSFHPSVLADKYDRDYTPFLLGYMGTQSMSQFSAMQPILNDISGKKAVFIVSPQWFDPKGQSKNAFQNYYSNLQGMYFLESAKDTEADKYAAKRYLQLTQNNDTLFKQVADGKPLSNSQKDKLRFKGNMLETEDMFFGSVKLNNNYSKKMKPKEKALPDTYNYDQLDKLAVEQAKANTTNNDFGIKNSFYNERLKESIGSLKGAQKHFDYTRSKEYNDFQLILNAFAEKNVDVLFVIPPINQKWIEYTGLDSVMYENTTKKIKYQLTSQGFNNVVDMSAEGHVPYSMQDTIHLGWRGWLKLDTYIEPFLTTKSKKLDYKLNDDFYSKDWAQKDPNQIKE